MSDEAEYSHPDFAPQGGPVRRREASELPLALLTAALFIGLVAMALQLAGERTRLIELRETQAPQVQQSKKFREQLQALGSETARLADDGDASARRIVEAMGQQGVTLKAPGK
jgi:DNA anti-recombination protein RmuC